MAVPVAANTDIPPLGVPTMPASEYNIPLNLSSIIWMIPGSRFLGWLRKGGNGFEPLDDVSVSEPSTTAIETLAIQASMLATQATKQQLYDSPQPQQQQIPPPFPGPWEFFTSGYIVGLFIMAVLLHRMQNVVIPSSRRNGRAYRTLHQTTVWERIHAMILPLDISRTTTRLILHIPSVYFLTKMLLVWILLALQTCEISLSFVVKEHTYWGGVLSFVEMLGKWAMKKDMAHVCWSTFCAVCGAFLVEDFIKALDGLGRNVFPLSGVNNLSPFHLISYAFLLHIYSSPVTHGFHPPNDLPSRPDKHVVITITIALLQLSMFHVLSISKRFTSHRLIPTTFTSLLSLIHFHTTLYFHFAGTPNPVPPATVVGSIPTAKITRRPPAYLAVNASYPLLNYVPNLFETLLLSTIFLTVSINAIAQLLVQGRIEQLFSGLGILPNGLPSDDDAHNGFLANLPYEEDFIIFLLRVGVASLEATGLRGWTNEVAPVQRPRVRPRRLWGLGGQRSELGLPPEDAYGRVRMGRFSVAQIEYGSTCLTSQTPPVSADVHSYDGIVSARRRSRRHTPGPSRSQRGFNNDIRIIDLGTLDGSPFSGPWTRNVIALWQFLVVLWGVLRGLVLVLLDKARGRARHSVGEIDGKTMFEIGEEPDADDDKESIKEAKSRRLEIEMYHRFLRGEEISDDDEDAGNIPLSDGDETSEDSDEGGADEEREAEAIGLFTDILRNGGSSPPSSSNTIGQREMVLAHLLHGSDISAHPLTRRRWNALVRRDRASSSEPTDVTNWVTDGNGGLSHGFATFDSHEREMERRDKEQGLEHICVICMLEKREVICWPCRCMAVCDGCRETLATRTPASKHRCPCCRQIVEGYSKIFIP